MLRSVKGQCKECYACVRACPVKAVRITASEPQISEEKCISCGRCIGACSQRAIISKDHREEVRAVLASQQSVFLILAPEYVASFYPLSSTQVSELAIKTGFHGVEEAIIGEELVADKYNKLLSSGKKPLIRSTCPAVVTWFEKYAPSLLERLAPIVSPMIAQGSLVKAFYGPDAVTVYAGPCFAQKSEAVTPSVIGAVDFVLTFDELKELFMDAIEKAKVGEAVAVQGVGYPEIARDRSVPGGFPRGLIASTSLIDREIVVVRGIENIDGLINAYERGEINPSVIDVLACHGCVDGPGIDSDLSVATRKYVISQSYAARLDRAEKQLKFDHFSAQLPEISLTRGYRASGLTLPEPTEQEIIEVLAEGEKYTVDDELNCRSCGYSNCRDLAVAVYQGFADWGMCLHYQKRLFVRLIDHLREQSVTDGLTGLANHKGFRERLSAEFSRAQRYKAPLSIAMLDVDQFKIINDEQGHVRGDQVLKGVARLIRDNIRQVDYAARYGGDEFVLILPETDQTKAFAVAEKLRREVESTPIQLPSGIMVSVTLSLGVSSYRSEIKDPFSLVERADKALYAAKQSGRNRTELEVEPV